MVVGQKVGDYFQLVQNVLSETAPGRKGWRIAHTAMDMLATSLRGTLLRSPMPEFV